MLQTQEKEFGNTALDLRILANDWLDIGWILAGYFAWILAGYWLDIGWILVGYWLGVGGEDGWHFQVNEFISNEMGREKSRHWPLMMVFERIAPGRGRDRAGIGNGDSYREVIDV